MVSDPTYLNIVPEMRFWGKLSKKTHFLIVNDCK